MAAAEISPLFVAALSAVTVCLVVAAVACMVRYIRGRRDRYRPGPIRTGKDDFDRLLDGIERLRARR